MRFEKFAKLVISNKSVSLRKNKQTNWWYVTCDTPNEMINLILLVHLVPCHWQYLLAVDIIRYYYLPIHLFTCAMLSCCYICFDWDALSQDASFGATHIVGYVSFNILFLFLERGTSIIPTGAPVASYTLWPRGVVTSRIFPVAPKPKWKCR